MMRLRFFVWLSLWLVGSYLVYRGELRVSQVNYDAGDRSAFAWHGFLPFLVPLFLAYSAVVVVPIAGVVELILLLRRRGVVATSGDGGRPRNIVERESRSLARWADRMSTVELEATLRNVEQDVDRALKIAIEAGSGDIEQRLRVARAGIRSAIDRLGRDE